MARVGRPRKDQELVRFVITLNLRVGPDDEVIEKLRESRNMAETVRLGILGITAPSVGPSKDEESEDFIEDFDF